MKTEAQNLLGMSEVKGKSKAFQHASDAYTSILWAKREVELDPSVLVKGTPEEFEKLANLAQSAVNKVHDALLRKK